MADIAELDLIVDSRQVKTATGELGIFIDAAGKAHDASGKFISSAKKLSFEAGALGKSLAFAASQALAFASASAALFALGAGVKAIAEFDKATTTLRGTIKGTAEDFADLRQQAKELGAATNFSAGDAAKAQLLLGRAGQDVNAIFATVPKVMDLATVGVIGLEEAATITTQALAQFRIGADEAGRVTDSLTVAANLAQTGVPELSEALKNAGVVSKATGKRFEDTVATLALLQDEGLQGAEAGTSLRTVIGKLLNPTGQAAAALDNLAKRSGQTRADFDISKKTFLEVSEALNKAGASTKELALIFGTEGVTGATILANAPEKLKAFQEAINGGQGAAEALAKIMADTLPGAFDSLTGSIESFFLQAGDAGLTKVMKDLLKLFADTIAILSGLATEEQEASKGAQSLAHGIEAVTLALVVFVALLAAQKIIGMARALGSVTQAFRLLNATMKANPILAIVALIAIITFALLEWADSFTELDGESVRVGNIMLATWEEVVLLLTALWDETTRFLIDLWEDTANSWNQIWGTSTEVLIEENKKIEDDSKSVWGRIKQATRDAVNAMIRPVVQFYRSVQVLLRTLAAGILAFKELEFTGGATAFAASVGAFGRTFAAAFNAEAVSKQITEDLTRDFVGEIGSAFESAGEVAGAAFSKSRERIVRRAKELQAIENKVKPKRTAGTTKPKTGAATQDIEAQAEGARKKIEEARRELAALQEALIQEKNLVGLNEKEKERLDIMTQTKDIAKKLLGIAEDVEVFNPKQVQVIDQMQVAMDKLLVRAQDARAFEELRVSATEAGQAVQEEFKAAEQALASVFATESQRLAGGIADQFSPQIKAMEEYIAKRVELGKISQEQADKETTAFKEQIDAITKLRIAADALGSAKSSLEQFTEGAEKAGVSLRRSIGLESVARQQDTIDQLVAPLKIVEQELIALREAGKLTEEQYSQAMAGIGQATKAAADFAADAEVLDNVRAFATSVSQEIGGMFKSIVLGTKTAEQAAADFFAALADIALTQIIIQPMVDLLASGITQAFAGATGLTTGATAAAAVLAAGGTTAAQAMVAGATQAAAILSAQAVAGSVVKAGAGAAGAAAGAANGAIYHSGVLKFAKGGILGGPALFGLRGGKLGLAGEAGPEAILPIVRSTQGPAVQSNAGPLLLRRQADGNLGVDAATKGRNSTADVVQPSSGQTRSFAGAPSGAPPQATNNVTFIVNTPAVDSFKKSSNQFSSQLRRVARGK